MDVVTLLLVVLVFGLIFWVVNSLIPMEQTTRRVINAVIAVIFVLWLLGALFPEFAHLRLGPTVTR